MTAINQNSIFYHIYPLGACGAPHFNDFQSAPEPRLRQSWAGWTISRASAPTLSTSDLFSNPTAMDTTLPITSMWTGASAPALTWLSSPTPCTPAV